VKPAWSWLLAIERDGPAH